MLAKKGEGTFSEVLKAQCIKTSKYVAIKCMKSNFNNIDQVHNECHSKIKSYIKI
jgi:renal tumor antigen